MSDPMDVYLEIGKKKVIAGSIDWPGWCRSAKTEDLALQALMDYAPRYAQIASRAQLAFDLPAQLQSFRVVERLPGNGSTDFGVPDGAPEADAQPVHKDDLDRFRRLLQACWDALDEISERAAGKTLRLGPRGGGRDLDSILQHVFGAEQSYLVSTGSKSKVDQSASFAHQLSEERRAALEALADAAHGKLETHGPRGGQRWSARYAVRRMAWHVLDHAWEIEDRIL